MWRRELARCDACAYGYQCVQTTARPPRRQSPRSKTRPADLSVALGLLRAGFEHQMLGEVDVQFRGRTLRHTKILAVFVIDDAIFSTAEAAQFHGSLPFRRIKAVVHFRALSDRMCLGGVETDIVQFAQIVAFR